MWAQRKSSERPGPGAKSQGPDAAGDTRWRPTLGQRAYTPAPPPGLQKGRGRHHLLRLVARWARGSSVGTETTEGPSGGERTGWPGEVARGPASQWAVLVLSLFFKLDSTQPT